MPIYEYRCDSCGHQKEFLQRMSDKPLTKCPKCGKRSFSKMMSAAGFHLKGTGWYATDFKNSGAKPAAKADKSEAKPDKPADSAKSADTAKPAESVKPAESAKPAASSSKDSSKSKSSTSAGTPPA